MIYSLDHCRSTVLDLYLGKELGFTSLGEVKRTAFPIGGERTALNREVCGCGSYFDNCELWSAASKDFYGYVSASDVCGFIDSSKNIRHFTSCKAEISNRVFVEVVVYRSFGNWYKSVLASLDREQRLSVFSIFRDRAFLGSSLRLYLRRYWAFAYLEYIVTYLRLVNACVRPIIIGDSSDVAGLVSDFSNKISKGKHFNHIFRGNRIRHLAEIELLQFSEKDRFFDLLTVAAKLKT